MNLADFLLARIADEDAAARDAEGWFQSTDWTSSRAAEHGDRWRPARVLATVHAYRMLVDCYEVLHLVSQKAAPIDGVPARAHQARITLLNLAKIYADHPDYRQEWKP